MATKIKSIGLTKLNSAEHVNFHNLVSGYLKTCTPEKISATAESAAYTPLIAAEQDLVKRQQGSVLSPQMEAADGKRDDLLVYFTNAVINAERSPLEAQTAAYAHIWPTVKPYVGIAKHAVGQESAEIKGLVSDLSGADFAAYVTALNLTEALAALDAANNAYIALDLQRTSEIPSKAETVALRDETDKAYTSIADKATATVLLSPCPEALQFVSDINNLIDRTNASYNQRMAQKGKKPENPEVPTDTGTQNTPT